MHTHTKAKTLNRYPSRKLITLSLLPCCQSSQHIASMTVSLPKSSPLLLFSGRSLPFPHFPLVFPWWTILCHLKSPSNLNPMRSARRLDTVFFEFVCHWTLRKPKPPFSGGSRAYCNIRPTAVDATLAFWKGGRMKMKPISVDRFSGSLFR